MRHTRILLALIAPVALAGQAATDAPVRVSGFDEALHPSLKVSGFHVEGFMRLTEDRSPDPNVISVWLVSGHEKLCVSARTVDGFYEATAEFDIQSTGSGVYPLDFESKKEFEAKKMEVFASYGAQELILRGRVGRDCTDIDTLQEVPMIWGCVGADCEEPEFLVDGGEQEARSYVLYLNSDGMDAEIVIPWIDRPNDVVRFPCTDVDTALERRDYDKTCEIDFHDDLDASRARIDFSYYGETQQPLSLTLLFLRDQ